MSSGGFAKPKLAAGFLLVALAVVAHGPGFLAGFIIDDDAYVTENESLRDLRGLGRIWFDLEASPQYYPMVFSTFWLEHQLWGDSPVGYHASNIVLHALNALLVWVVLVQLGVPGAWLAAALFAVHPVHVESVAWVAERKNVLSALFYLASASCFVRWRATAGSLAARGSSRGLYWASIVCFVLAMLSKTASVSLPIVLLLLIWWKDAKVERRDAIRVAPMLVVGLGLSLITIWIETTRGGASGELWDLSLIDRFIVASQALWFYAWKLVWPVGLSFNYPRWSVDSGVWWQYLYPISLGVLLWVLWRWRRELGRGLLAGALCFIVILGPTLGFVNVYFFRYSFVADHFQYLASLGLLTLVAAVSSRWFGEGRGTRFAAARLAQVSVILLLAILTWQRSWIFRDLETLCLDTKEENPASWLAVNNLGNIYLQRGELAAAETQLVRARELSPDALETLLNLAILYMNQGRYEESIASSRRAIELRPENKFAYKHLADAYFRSGQAEAAILWYYEALARDPESLQTMVGLGTALTQSAQYERAVEVLSQALGRQPESVAARTSLGIALARLGEYAGAVEQLELAVALDPANRDLLANLALAREMAAAARSSDEE